MWLGDSGGCWVFPWGISWLARGDGSARWEEITGVQHSNHTEVRPGPTGALVTPTDWTSTRSCTVQLTDGRSIEFWTTFKWKIPVSWKKLKPVPGKIRGVNIAQLERLLKMGMAGVERP